ncbi:MAG: bactofilin family protein [Limnohabitans sp.]|jgi:cytoskeletal protein CcmA (bactofilin family)
MFNKFKATPNNEPAEPVKVEAPTSEEVVIANAEPAPEPVVVAPQAAPKPNGMMGMLQSNVSKPSILSEGFYFKGELSAKGAIHVEGSLNGQVQVDELTIGSRGQVDGIVSCKNFHIKGRFAGTATCEELTVTSSATVDGHVVYKTLSVQKGASIKGELLLAKS